MAPKEAYKPARNIPINPSSSPSLLFNNLSIHRNFMAFADGDAVHVVDAAKETKRSVPFTASPEVVLSVHLDTFFDGVTALVIAHYRGMSVWLVGDDYQNKWRLLGSHHVNGFARGIARSGQDVFVGCSSGSVAILSLSGTRDVDLKAVRSAHSSAITALAASKTGDAVIVTADERGEVRLWEADDLAPRAKGELHALDVGRSDEPVTSVALPTHALCIAGFATGHLRVYVANASGTGLIAELQAHSRPIAAIDTTNDKVCTVSADTYLHVWSIRDRLLEDFDSKDDAPIIMPLYSKRIDNVMLTGAKFAESSARPNLVLAAYDSDYLFTFESSGTLC